MQNRDSNNLFYFNFKSELENFIKKYLQIQENHNLKEAKKNSEKNMVFPDTHFNKCKNYMFYRLFIPESKEIRNLIVWRKV